MMTAENINLQDLEGTWYIVLTNFPMWLKGDKTRPTFNYTITQHGSITGLRDEVRSWKHGKEQVIVGFDTPLDTTNRRFVWRGKGLLSLLTSRWEIVYFDAHKEWAIIHFEKTLFTPEGYDVIARNPTYSEEVSTIMAKLLLILSVEPVLESIAQD